MSDSQLLQNQGRAGLTRDLRRSPAAQRHFLLPTAVERKGPVTAKGFGDPTCELWLPAGSEAVRTVPTGRRPTPQSTAEPRQRASCQNHIP